MKKSELKIGMVIKVRNGGVYVVMRDANDKLIAVNNDGWLNLETYHTENLDYYNRYDNEWDIMEVYSLPSLEYQLCFNNIFNLTKRTLIYTRPTPKKLTIAEIENLLGYPIQIVK